MKEYTVTLNSFSDKTSFCNEMTASNGSGSVPSRVCACNLMRPQSRNTIFTLSDTEATELLNDSRVKACEENVELYTTECWDESQYGKWDKSPEQADDKNWGIKRCIDGQQTSGWGAGGGTSELTGTYNTTSSGKNVDVIIVDSHANLSHPEFRENPDGTGSLRSNEFNWFQYSSALGYGSNTAATYSYSTITSSHGTHVAGTVAGNTQGWARDANIYNTTFAGDAGGNNGIDGINWTAVLFEYIRYFHNNKPINAATGRRNPTIVNNSWAVNTTASNILLSNITGITYRSVTTDLSSMTTAEKRTALESRRIPVPSSTYGDPFDSDRIPRMGARNASIDADIEDAIGDGVIFVGAAGNNHWPIDKSGGNDYNNILFTSSGNYYSSRGSSPGNTETSNGNSISVGAISFNTNDRKIYFSNCEERVDVFAPGVFIMSSVANSSSGYNNQNADSRDSNYYNASSSGTSMSSPQVAGLLACAAEQYPNMRQEDALQYVIESAGVDQVADTSEGMVASPYTDLGDSNNRYAAYVFKRPQSGTVFPHDNHGNRLSSSNGVKYPRVNSVVTKPV